MINNRRKDIALSRHSEYNEEVILWFIEINIDGRSTNRFIVAKNRDEAISEAKLTIPPDFQKATVISATMINFPNNAGYGNYYIKVEKV